MLSDYSIQKLITCDQQLVDLIIAVELIHPLVVATGYRSKDDQDAAYTSGKSQLPWPNSKHNSTPSRAVDVYPLINGKLSYNPNHCSYLAGIIMAAAFTSDIKLRWGGNWDSDGEVITDQTFNDLGHFELV